MRRVSDSYRSFAGRNNRCTGESLQPLLFRHPGGVQDVHRRARKRGHRPSRQRVESRAGLLEVVTVLSQRCGSHGKNRTRGLISS